MFLVNTRIYMWTKLICIFKELMLLWKLVRAKGAGKRAERDVYVVIKIS